MALSLALQVFWQQLVILVVRQVDQRSRFLRGEVKSIEHTFHRIRQKSNTYQDNPVKPLKK